MPLVPLQVDPWLAALYLRVTAVSLAVVLVIVYRLYRHARWDEAHLSIGDMAASRPKPLVVLGRSALAAIAALVAYIAVNSLVGVVPHRLGMTVDLRDPWLGWEGFVVSLADTAAIIAAAARAMPRPYRRATSLSLAGLFGLVTVLWLVSAIDMNTAQADDYLAIPATLIGIALALLALHWPVILRPTTDRVSAHDAP